MDRTSREDRKARQRIAALLFAFAVLADRAGATPCPIRVAVLWLLRAVESIAWEFVVAVAQESGRDPNLAVPAYAHDIADDAGRLARSFTALAELLADLTRRNPSPAPHGRISGLVARLMQTLWSAAHRRAPARPFPDTS
jgi:hypothetical protein